MPSIITSSDYNAIRTALGLDEGDTTNLPDAVIEAVWALDHVEAVVKEKISDWADVIDSMHADYDADQHKMIRAGVVFATAANVAMHWLDGRRGREITNTSEGPVSTGYREGADWSMKAERLLREAERVLHKVLWWGEDVQRIDSYRLAGRTRRMQTDETQITSDEWSELMTPEVVRGQLYQEEPWQAD